MFYKKKENPPSNIKFNDKLNYMGDFGRRTEDKRIRNENNEFNLEEMQLTNPLKKIKTEYLKVNKIYNRNNDLKEFFKLLDQYFFAIKDNSQTNEMNEEEKEINKTTDNNLNVIEEINEEGNNSMDNEEDLPINGQYEKINGIVNGITKKKI
jgi:hypothetical protein